MKTKCTLSFLLMILSGFFIQINAQTTVTSGLLADDAGYPMTDTHILRVTLTPQNTDGSSEINSSFVLSQVAIVDWEDYSTNIRFSSIATNPAKPYFDFRNGGGFDIGNDTMFFQFGETYDFWIEADVYLLTYNVHFQSGDMTEPIEVATDLDFRNITITELSLWSVLVGDGINNPLLAENIMYVDNVGDRFPVAIKSFNSTDAKIYPNPSQGTLNIKNPSSEEFSYEIYSITGELVANRNYITGSVSTVNMENFAKGMYFINIKSSETFETLKFILK